MVIFKHFNLLTCKFYRPSNTLIYLSKTLQKYCQKEAIDIKVIKTSDLKKTEKYMRGQKSINKMKKVLIDRNWRKSNNLENIIATKTFLTINEIEDIECYINGFNRNVTICEVETTYVDGNEYTIITYPNGEIHKFPLSSLIK
jgi:hypothetical protein